MNKKFVVCALVALVFLMGSVVADVYMHFPRGSNNRLNENGVNRDNANRLFDSQNNGKGGYCWGPSTYYYTGSKVMIEWTNQHACHNPLVLCEIVLQYMCGTTVRDGTVTTTIPDDANTFNQKVTPDPLTGENKAVYKYGMNEDYQYYQDCKARERNKGLFTADQNMNGRNSARHTRQDNNGNRYGFECPEERDYYPYWHPSPWKDVAILVNNMTMCSYFQRESQNVKAKNFCSDAQFNNKASCENGGGTWETKPSWGIDPPVCEEAQFTRDNHLGNSVTKFHQGYASSFNWTIPDQAMNNCVLRLRYNISTADYEGWNTVFADARLNGDKSPVKQYETVSYFGKNYTLAINTDQFGRTFQDRSHIFHIRQRPSHIDDDAIIWNVGVRGKRGNIVQVYPAVEYDFVPGRLHLEVGDYVHFQWTGCDTNPAGNDGEGTRQTDRSNVAQMLGPAFNKPSDIPLVNRFKLTRMFDDTDTQARMAFIDQVNCLSMAELRAANNNNDNDIEQDVRNCMKLNGAPTPYFDGGVLRLNNTGTFHYMSTRNNNFSNRSQKATLVVTDDSSTLPLWAVGAVGVGVVAFAAAAVVAGLTLYAKSHPAAFAATAAAV
eukprot:CAMPEP_0184332064 /NCGR_PEP_ID=MMETSP1089-20130417/1332_1 /TAXON_ID=38269 ORGANISM="Gloeochaete wittrockiana, Strain SAG46.84" /NCGR_SAMPLE_ID=MMETSP1089 /ASSEMBLY_ACC=CAM_ASM_000445 /LENGTH=605 /DNA_ID=CAMNT_0026655291 /DNA_START=151 /DNA_END=1968 /DNA_ORIENTATION=+